VQRAAIGGVQPDIAGVAVEGQAEIGGLAEAIPALQRMGDGELDVLALQRPRQPGDGNLPEVAGVDADHLVRAQRGQHPVDRQRPCHAEIRRAIDRDCSRGAGVVDDVADPHQVARYRDIGAQHRRRDGVVAGLAQCGRGRGGEQGDGEGKRTDDHFQRPQRNILEVDCSIWSAALMTLAFIS
jgi:hypothetical protein